MPFHSFRRGAFAVHIGDHLRFGILGLIYGLGIICGAVQFSQGGKQRKNPNETERVDMQVL